MQRSIAANVPKALLRTEVTDPEVHIGKNMFGATSDLSIFKQYMAKLNVVRAILIPESTYELQLQNGYTEQSCIWNVDQSTGEIHYKRILFRGEERIEEPNPKAPLLSSNKHYLEVVKYENKHNNSWRRFYFAPILHPKLDTPEDIEQFLNEDATVGIKMHGISGHFTPNDVPGWVPKLAKSYDIPFIIHTDYVDSSATTLRGKHLLPDSVQLSRDQRPLKWAKWVDDNGVSAYLAHGIRLDAEAAKLVNRNDLMITGTGPDYVINMEKQRLLVKDKDYLTCLFEMLEPNRIAYSSDFAWNWINSSDMTKLDWEMKNRVIAAGLARGLSNKEIKAVMNGNSIRIFGL